MKKNLWITIWALSLATYLWVSSLKSDDPKIDEEVKKEIFYRNCEVISIIESETTEEWWKKIEKKKVQETCEIITPLDLNLKLEGYENYYDNERIRNLTKNILKIYNEKHKGKEFFVDESATTKWDPEINNSSYFVMKINNGLIHDTTILSEDGFKKIFWFDLWRKDYSEMKAYADYLNLIKDREIKK